MDNVKGESHWRDGMEENEKAEKFAIYDGHKLGSMATISFGINV